MALSLIARSLNRPLGYSCFLRNSTITFKNTNATLFSNKATFTALQKFTRQDQNKNVALMKPLTRNMAGSGDFRLMWTVERIFAVSLLGLLPLTIAFPNAVFDNVSSIMVVLHFHWGLEAMAGDYLRPIVVGAAISKISLISVYIISAVTLGGLLYFNYTDIGVGKSIRKFWAIKSN